MHAPAKTAVFFTSSFIAGCLCLPAAVLAQSHRPEFLAQPLLSRSMSASAIDALNYELNQDFTELDAFGQGKRGLGRFANSAAANRPQPWTVYGRFGLFNFQNRITEQKLSETDIGWRRTGPSLTGRYYIGVHKQFW
jgi:hypothetical protein